MVAAAIRCSQADAACMAEKLCTSVSWLTATPYTTHIYNKDGTRHHIMTSEERREARYMRRKTRREEKRRNYYRQFDDIENVVNMTNMMKSAQGSARGVMWKPSVQRFMMNDLRNMTELRKKVLTGEDVRKGFICFDVVERGKRRHIQSVHISERVVQKALSQAVLQPALAHDLIYDNGACIKGKGTEFAIKRLTKHLHDHYRNYGNEGYVLLYDFSGYFDSIPHDKVKAKQHSIFTDEKLLLLADRFIDAFEGDKGLGLGSEICQIHAVAYPSSIDHIAKDKFGIHGYGRYMDDGYAISNSKEELKTLYAAIKAEAKRLGLTINEKKSQIVKLSHGFKFLKTKFMLTKTGRVLRLPWKRSIVRQRRKLKKFRELYEKRKITLEEILNPFYSWLGYMSRKTAHRTVMSMIRLFRELFPEYKEELKWKTEKQTRLLPQN